MIWQLTQQPNERWNLDFVNDQLAKSRALRLLTLHDDYTRECVWTEADIYLSGPRVTRLLDHFAEPGDRPSSILTDNGPKFAGLGPERWTTIARSSIAPSQQVNPPGTAASSVPTISSAMRA